FVKIDRLDGTAELYGPAPQSAFEESRPADRIFAACFKAPVSEAEVEAYLAREIRFDSDLWIVEVEDRSGPPLVELVVPGRRSPRAGALGLRLRAGTTRDRAPRGIAREASLGLVLRQQWTIARPSPARAGAAQARDEPRCGLARHDVVKPGEIEHARDRL